MTAQERIAEASIRMTVAQFIGQDLGQVSETADFSEDLGMDSLDRLGLMAAVTWHLGRSAIVDVPTVGLAIGAALLLLTLRPNSTWLVLGGAVAGWVLQGGS